MASAEVLDFVKLLAPIPGENATGVDLRDDASPTSLYYAIKGGRAAARTAERKLAQGDDPTTVSPPDWRPVMEQSRQALAEKSKDLEVAAFLIEALLRERGFAGLRDGFRLVRELIEKYWDGLYPKAEQDGLAERVAPLTGLNGEELNGTLIDPIAQVPITDLTSVGQFTCAHYHEGVALARVTDAKAREKRIEKGKVVPLETIQRAVVETTPKFYKALAEDLTQSIEQFGQLTAVLDQRCGAQAPPTSRIRSTLQATLDIVKVLAKDKIEAPAEQPKKKEEKPGKDGAQKEETQKEEGLRTREDAFRSLLEVADFFRRTEPQSVVPHALEQVVRWGRMSLPELLLELIPDEAPRKNLFKQVGIRPPEPPPKETAKK